MTRRLITATAALLTALLALSSAALAADLRLAPAAGPRFPSRSYVLTIPEGADPSAGSVAFSENGAPVSGLQIRSATGSRGGLGVVLVIDSSRSMHGAPIAAAMGAARAFAARRPRSQPLGIVTFNDAPVVLTRPTTDSAEIARVLRNPPPLGHGTHIYDATAAALRLLSGRQTGAVVLLSDGSDSGSSTTAATVAAAARRAKIQIFSVGLRSGVFNPSTLRDVATGSGSYLGAVSAPALSRLYQELGGQLANAYIVRYRSTAPAGRRVAVVASVGGASARLSYTAPTPASLLASVPRRVGAPPPGFLATAKGVTAVSLAVLVLVFGGLMLPLAQSARRRRIRGRVSDYALPGTAGDASLRLDQLVATPSVARDGGRMARLAELLEIGGMQVSATQVVAGTIVGTIAAGWLAWVLTHFALFVVIVVGCTPFAVRGLIRMRVARRRRLFADQLPDALQATAAAMRTGHSFAGALAQLVHDAAQPSASEFARVIADERLGVPLEDALASTSVRMDNSDIDQVALVAVLQRETGGNGAEALDRVVENLRAREEVRRLVTTLTAQGRLSRWVLTGIPVVLGLGLTVINPDYMAPLYESGIGRFMLIVAVLLVLTGSLLMKRVVDNVKV